MVVVVVERMDEEGKIKGSESMVMVVTEHAQVATTRTFSTPQPRVM